MTQEVKPPAWIDQTVCRMKDAIQHLHRYSTESPRREIPDPDETAVYLAQVLTKRTNAKMRLAVVGTGPEDDPQFHHCYIELWWPERGIWLSLDPQQAIMNFDVVCRYDLDLPEQKELFP